jgi:hypothetical protein
MDDWKTTLSVGFGGFALILMTQPPLLAVTQGGEYASVRSATTPEAGGYKNVADPRVLYGNSFSFVTFSA